jgi:hypothetical protein
MSRGFRPPPPTAGSTGRGTNDRVSSTLDPHERLNCLVVTTEPWTVDHDLVTPALKVKRNRIEDTFAKHYEAWVGAGKPVVCSRSYATFRANMISLARQFVISYDI